MGVFHYRRRVEFADTDAAGIAHFTSLIRYAESAEHALLRSLGGSVMPSASRRGLTPHEAKDGADDGEQIAWPRVRIEVDFAAPAFFEDELDIAVQIEKLGRSSVRYRMSLYLASDNHRLSQADSEPVDVERSVQPEGSFAEAKIMGQRVCVVWIVTVCCSRNADGKLMPHPIPQLYRDRLAPYALTIEGLWG